MGFTTILYKFHILGDVTKGVARVNFEQRRTSQLRNHKPMGWTWGIPIKSPNFMAFYIVGKFQWNFKWSTIKCTSVGGSSFGPTTKTQNHNGRVSVWAPNTSSSRKHSRPQKGHGNSPNWVNLHGKNIYDRSQFKWEIHRFWEIWFNSNGIKHGNHRCFSMIFYVFLSFSELGIEAPCEPPPDVRCWQHPEPHPKTWAVKGHHMVNLWKNHRKTIGKWWFNGI